MHPLSKRECIQNRPIGARAGLHVPAGLQRPRCVRTELAEDAILAAAHAPEPVLDLEIELEAQDDCPICWPHQVAA